MIWYLCGTSPGRLGRRCAREVWIIVCWTISFIGGTVKLPYCLDNTDWTFIRDSYLQMTPNRTREFHQIFGDSVDKFGNFPKLVATVLLTKHSALYRWHTARWKPLTNVWAPDVGQRAGELCQLNVNGKQEHNLWSSVWVSIQFSLRFSPKSWTKDLSQTTAALTLPYASWNRRLMLRFGTGATFRSLLFSRSELLRGTDYRVSLQS